MFTASSAILVGGGSTNRETVHLSSRVTSLSVTIQIQTQIQAQIQTQIQAQMQTQIQTQMQTQIQTRGGSSSSIK